MNQYTDRRILLSTREPKENEFIFHRDVKFCSEDLSRIFCYIEKISNQRLKIYEIDRENFANQDMRGIRIVYEDK